MNGNRIAGLGLGAVVLCALALPLWPAPPRSSAGKLDDRMDALERRLDRVDEKARANEAKHISGEARVDEVLRRLNTLSPPDAHWIDLRSGGGNKWLLPNGEEASVKFLGAGDSGGVLLRVAHKTLQTDVTLRPGEQLEAVDDLATERRIYTTQVLAVRRERGGAPVQALVSVSYRVETAM